MKKVARFYSDLFSAAGDLVKAGVLLSGSAGLTAIGVVDMLNKNSSIGYNPSRTYSQNSQSTEFEQSRSGDYYYGEEDPFSFCQLFVLNNDTSLIIDHVEYCPEETAFIRIITDDAYSPLYKRKVTKDKLKNRFITYDKHKLFLDDKKTQPKVQMEKKK